jgi:predicted phage-related endonuclease
VYLEKRGELRPEADRDPHVYKPWLAAGNLFEEGVLKYAESVLGPITRNQRRVKRECHLACNIDALVTETGDPIETKIMGLFGPVGGEWGEPGSGEVPEYVVYQAHGHMIVTGAPLCHVPVFLAGRGFSMYQVDRHDGLCEALEELAAQFWTEHVVPGVPPADVMPCLDSLKRIKRVAGPTADIPVGLLARLEDAKAMRKAAERAEDLLKREVLTALGNCEQGKDSDGGTAKYPEYQRRSVDTDRMKADGFYQEYARIGHYRQLRVKLGNGKATGK